MIKIGLAITVIFLCLAFVLPSVGSARSPLDVSDDLLGLTPAAKPSATGTAATPTARPSDFKAVAYVNMPKVLMLHPLMASYQVEAGSFIRPLPVDEKAQWRELTEQRRSKAKALEEVATVEKKRVSEEIKEIDRKKATARRELNSSIVTMRTQLNQKLARAKSNKARTKLYGAHSKSYSKVHDAFWKDFEVLEKREQYLIERRRVLDERVARQAFLDGKERERMLFRIEREVIAAIRSVVTRRKYALVFNSGYLREPVTKAPNIRHTVGVGARGYYSTPYLEFLHEEKAPGTGHGARMSEGSLSSWEFSSKALLEQTYPNTALSSFLLMGGDDITEYVVDLLLRKHRVSRPKRLFLIKRFFRR